MTINRYPSTYLPGVEALLSSLDDNDEQWDERLRRMGPIFAFSGADDQCLRIALQLTTPFNDSGPDGLKDVRAENALPPMRCQDRTRLEEALVKELWRYKQSCELIEQTPRNQHAKIIHSMEQLSFSVAPLAIGSQKRLFNRIQKACQTIASDVEFILTNPPKKGRTGLPSKDELQRMLVQRMCLAFETYGPSKWTLEPIYFATATILVRFGVEDEGVDEEEEKRLKTISAKYRKWRTSPEHRPTPRAELVYRLWDQPLSFSPRPISQS